MALRFLRRIEPIRPRQEPHGGEPGARAGYGRYAGGLYSLADKWNDLIGSNKSLIHMTELADHMLRRHPVNVIWNFDILSRRKGQINP